MTKHVLLRDRARSATVRTSHQIRGCDFLYLFRGHVLVAMCSRVRSSHSRPHHCVDTGVPWVSLQGPPFFPAVPRQDGIGTNQLLCAVLVLRRRGTRIQQSGTVELVLCVLTNMKCQHSFSKGLNGQLSRSRSFSHH